MYPKRVQDNHNLTIWPESEFQGLPIHSKGPLVTEYLQKLLSTINNARQAFPRVMAVRIDLRCPALVLGLGSSNQVMERFKKAMDSRIAAYQRRRSKAGKPVYSATVRMVWAREQHESRVPHFHILLLLNRELFHSLGQYHDTSGSLMTLIVNAWDSAVGIPSRLGGGLVHIPSNPYYYLNRSDQYLQLPELFRRASYLCKLDTKCFGQGISSFGASRG